MNQRRDAKLASESLSLQGRIRDALEDEVDG